MTILEDPLCAIGSISCQWPADTNEHLWPPQQDSTGYYSRGPLGLNGNEAYGKFSRAYYEGMYYAGEYVLLEYPDEVVDMAKMYIESAVW